MKPKYPTKVILLGLIGITGVLLQNLLTMGPSGQPAPLDFFALASVLAFAAALPLLSFSFLIREQPHVIEEGIKPGRAMSWMTGLGIIVALIAVLFAFAHVSLFAGGVFLVVGAVAFVIYLTAFEKIEQAASSKLEKDHLSVTAVKDPLQKMDKK